MKNNANRHANNPILLFPLSIGSTFHCLLTVLAVFDSLYLSFCVLNEGLQINVEDLASERHPVPERTAWVVMYPKFLYPMKQILLSCSTYMTSFICINRYV